MAAIERTSERDEWKAEAQEVQQRLSTEWQSRPTDDTHTIMEHLNGIAQPPIDRYVAENRLGHVRNATPAQMDDLVARIKNKTGITEDNARLAVLSERVHSYEAEQYNRWTTQQQNKASEHEYLLDVIRGKDGPAVVRELDLYREAAQRAEPLLQYAAEHQTGGVGYIDESQRERLATEIARDSGIPYANALEAVSNAVITAQHDREVKEWQRFAEAVGESNAEKLVWKQESGGIQSYRHMETGKHLHLDVQGQFYNQDREPIGREAALNRVLDVPTVQEQAHSTTATQSIQADRPQVATFEQSIGLWSRNERASLLCLPFQNLLVPVRLSDTTSWSSRRRRRATTNKTGRSKVSGRDNLPRSSA